MSVIEHGLATAIGFVTKPVGAAIATVAIASAVGGVVYVKHWWAGIEAKDDTITQQGEQLMQLAGNLRDSEQAAAEARLTFQRRETDLQNQIQVAAGEARSQRVRASRLAARIEELRGYAPDQTGPLAPVLRDAFDSVRDDLRGLTAAT